MASEVTKYQYFLDSIKLVLKLKGLVDEAAYKKVIEEKVKDACKGINEDGEKMFKDFLLNLSEASFYEDCMAFYLDFQKYEPKEEKEKNITFLDFQKLRLLDTVIK